MSLNKLIYYSTLLSVLFLFSCDKKDDEEPDTDPEIPEETLILTNWIWDVMEEVYLWTDYLPSLDPDKQKDPEAYFYNLLYYKDQFSFIHDDYDELLSSFEGVSLSTGISAQPSIYGEGDDVVSFILYVEPGSPADEAGLKRGDMFISINGEDLNRYNYFDLMDEETITLGLAKYTGATFIASGEEATVSGVVLNENPVHYYSVIDYGGQKTGYLVYNSFTFGEDDEWLTEIITAFEYFQSEGVSDVIFDLRYNGGGYGYVSAYLAGILAPASVSQNEEIFQIQIWNDLLTEYWKQVDLDDDGEPDGEESSQLVERFTEPDVLMDLNRVFFITTGSSASASESLMVGLYPYMDVTQVGGTTRGKCYGSIAIGDVEEPARHDWVVLPLVLKYANADGFTDFDAGIDADVEAEESYTDLKPFGSMDDPLLAKALEVVTGEAVPAKKSVQDAPRLELLRKPELPRLEQVDMEKLKMRSGAAL